MRTMTLTLTAVNRDYYTFTTTVLIPADVDLENVNFKSLSRDVDADDYERDDGSFSGEWDHLDGELTPSNPGAVPAYRLVDGATLKRIEQGGCMAANKDDCRNHQVDGSEYEEVILQRQLCSMLQMALNEGYCMDHAKESLIKHLTDQIWGYRQAKPTNQAGNLDNGPDPSVDVAIDPEFIEELRKTP